METINETENSAVSSVVPLVVNCKHVVYPFTARSNTSTLKLATSELQALKEDVKTQITNARRDNGVPTKQAQQWLGRVETIEGEVEEIQRKYEQLFRCIKIITPNVWAIYKISRSAVKKLDEVKNLCAKGANLSVICYMPPPLSQEMPVSSSIPPNLESALHDVRDDAYGIIGIWGMGGVGKTHLLKHINNELSRDCGAFDVVVFVTCSQDCTEEKVQNEIIKKLELGNSDSLSKEQKQSTIFNFLKGKSFVILLDDLWSRIDLNTIGISDLTNASSERKQSMCKRKVVLTTRSGEVCSKMEASKKIKVEVLNRDDAWCLFKEKVSEETINSDLLIQKYAVDVMNELGRLPLALITVGRAMRDKKDHSEWELAMDQLKEAHKNDLLSGAGNESVFHRLRFSYDSVENETTMLFAMLTVS